MTTNNGVTQAYPPQKLPRSKKTEEWGRKCVDWILSSSSTTYKDMARIKANYDLYNNIISEEDFNYVTNPYGVDNKFPARLHNYNIITPKLNLLIGEEIKRPFNYRIVAVNNEAVSQLQEKRKELLMQYLESQLVAELQAQGVNVQDPQTGEVMTPPQIEEYMNYSDSDIRESTANRLANYLIKRENLEYKFNKGFKDALISDTEIYYIGSNGSDPVVELVNPLDFDYDKNPDLDFIQDGQWAKHTKYCTMSEVIDQFGDELTDGEIDKLHNGSYGATSGSHATFQINSTVNQPSYRDSFSADYISVTRVEWKSLRKIGFLKYYDENMEEQETIVDETYKAQKDLGETIEWRYINEVWEGTKIGDSIYVNIRPKKVQYRSIDNPSICKLGYVGAVFNNRNSSATSLVDLVKHHQYLYNVIMYRMELEIAKAKGKKMVMDIAQIPKSQGMDLEKWMYYFDSVGLAFINSFEEGSGSLGQGRASQFNQFTAVDMSLSQSVGQYVSILNKIEEQTETLMGVSRQRQGSITSSETVGGVERAVIQSSTITEPLFYMHSEIKKHVLSQLIETAKVVYPEGKKINYVMDDMNRVMLEISDGFEDADYGVFVTTGSKEIKALEDLRSLAQQASASGLMKLSDMIKIFDSNSMADIKASIMKSEKEAQENAQQQQQFEAEEAEKARAAEFDQVMALEDRYDNREYIKGELALEREQVKALGFSQDTDSDQNGIPDVLEYEKLAQSDRQHSDKLSLESRKLDIEKEKLAVQERIANKKAEVDKIKARKSGSTSK